MDVEIALPTWPTNTGHACETRYRLARSVIRLGRVELRRRNRIRVAGGFFRKEAPIRQRESGVGKEQRSRCRDRRDNFSGQTERLAGM